MMRAASSRCGLIGICSSGNGGGMAKAIRPPSLLQRHSQHLPDIRCLVLVLEQNVAGFKFSFGHALAGARRQPVINLLISRIRDDERIEDDIRVGESGFQLVYGLEK